eukprot:SAG31_NODE_1858_length_7061_cov_60.221201_1_plen_126_part_00
MAKSVDGELLLRDDDVWHALSPCTEPCQLSEAVSMHDAGGSTEDTSTALNMILTPTDIQSQNSRPLIGPLTAKRRVLLQENGHQDWNHNIPAIARRCSPRSWLILCFDYSKWRVSYVNSKGLRSF